MSTDRDTVGAHLAAAMAGMAALTTGTPADAAALLAGLRAQYHTIFHADFSAYDAAALKPVALDLQRRLFEQRLALRRRIPAWEAAGLVTHDVQVAVRDLLRAARYAGDMLTELHLGHPRLEGGASQSAFTGDTLALQVNPAFAAAPFALMPGDVILQRGLAHNSAAIARIGDVDSQFSHVAIVAKDAHGAPVVVEALIEDGSVVNPLAKAMAHGIGRAVLFRHRDAGLAREASELIYSYVARANQSGGEPSTIPYDFSMELGVYHPLYCAKLLRMAYAMASDGAVRLPRYPTLLDMTNRDFLDRVGVSATTTFAPGDMEIEPDFDIVAEWRDCRVTSELRLKDLIMTKLFHWMETENYRFEPSVSIDMVSMLGRLSTHMPQAVQDIVASVVAKIPANMTFDAIGAVAMLHKTAEPLFTQLVELERESIARTGHQLHPRQVFEALEAMRAGDPGSVGYLVRG
jgi:hypothetical protein